LKRLIPLDECGEYFPVHLFPPLPLHNSWERHTQATIHV
jgi:hypothetical protein